MFLKPFRVKTQTQIKGSDRKKLRAEISKWYPTLSEGDLTQLIPAKEEMKITKIYTHSGENGLIYSLQKKPIFFEIDRVVYPTVNILWQYPYLVPNFTTWPEVFKKIAGGADLMLPGVVARGPITPTTFGNLQKGDICSVNLYGNRAPVAIGTAAMSGSDMFESGMRGKGVHMIHMYGDELWAFGDKSEPTMIKEDESDQLGTESNNSEGNEQVPVAESNSVPEQTETQGPDDVCDGVEKLQIGSEESKGDNSQVTTEASGQGDEKNDLECNKEMMDELFIICFKCALKKSLKNTDLPIITSTFYKTHMTPFCPENKSLDVKKSSYKKLSKFLKQMEKEGFIKVKELSKGVDSIVDMDKTHSDLRGFTPPEEFCVRGGDLTTATTEEEEAEDTSYPGPPEITDMFSITAAVVPFVKHLSYSKGDALTSSDFRKIMIDYVKSNELQDEISKNYVNLDPMLAESVLKKDEGNVIQLKWEELFSRLLSKMTPVHRVVFPGQQTPIYRKGKVECIKVDVIQRASNKKVTLVENLELFGINSKVFAHCVQVKMGCSATVQSSAAKNKGSVVQVQGNQIHFVANLINEKYGIHRKYIQGLEKAPKSGKKR